MYELQYSLSITMINYALRIYTKIERAYGAVIDEPKAQLQTV